jgi:hypothetical protein
MEDLKKTIKAQRNKGDAGYKKNKHGDEKVASFGIKHLTGHSQSLTLIKVLNFSGNKGIFSLCLALLRTLDSLALFFFIIFIIICYYMCLLD